LIAQMATRFWMVAGTAITETDSSEPFIAQEAQANQRNKGLAA